MPLTAKEKQAQYRARLKEKRPEELERQKEKDGERKKKKLKEMTPGQKEEHKITVLKASGSENTGRRSVHQ
jgi:hypothetical protein